MVDIQQRTRERLIGLALYGAGLWTVGAIITAVSFHEWSHPGFGRDDSALPVFGLFAGGMVLTVGAALLLVVVIAWGIRLGSLLDERYVAARPESPVPARRSDGPDVRAEGL